MCNWATENQKRHTSIIPAYLLGAEMFTRHLFIEYVGNIFKPNYWYSLEMATSTVTTRIMTCLGVEIPN